MANSVTISVDAMGGDHGPAVTIAGADIALRRRPDSEFVFYGDGNQIEEALAQFPALMNRARVTHTDNHVNMSDKPSLALRRGRWKSGMWLSIDAVKKGEADVAVSAGNTGALMAMSRLCLRTMAGMNRPAIAALWPTLAGESVVLDVGATIGADAQQLVDYAVMGGAMARALFKKSRPTVGLLNIGVEEVKGLEEVREAGRMLREADLPHLDYVGFVEGDDLGKGMVDVAVTEGFAGNIALKTAEGTARQVASYIRDAMGKSLRARLGYLLAKPAMDSLREKLDPNRINGGVLLGLNGIVIKSHGGATATAFASALVQGHAMASNGLQAKIHQDHADLYPADAPETAMMANRAGAV